MAGELSAPPVLSTPAEHVFEHAGAAVAAAEHQSNAPQQQRSDSELRDVYEIGRTAREIREARCKRVALQFPDSMLCDAPRIAGLLHDELAARALALAPGSSCAAQHAEDAPPGAAAAGRSAPAHDADRERIYILADTSYSACCVDEVAAEHVDADVVVHYGRSCLSPTSRLPVIYVFTRHSLDRRAAVEAFEHEFPDKQDAVVLMADVAYQDHVPSVFAELRDRGYRSLLSTAVVHDPRATIPNRRVLDGTGHQVETTASPAPGLKGHSVFHISTPPTSLLLALSARVQSLCVFPTPDSRSSSSVPSTGALLGRRYARVLSLSTAGIIGILINTLSVSNYLSSVDSIRKQIAAAGKKSYTIVVGKLNPAKLANFAEVDGWVVVGCWESSLVEDDAGFYRPVVTPFELEVALMKDEDRVWGESWWGGIEGVREPGHEPGLSRTASDQDPESAGGFAAQEQEADGGIDDEESAPPEFDLRTGKLVSHSRPMRMVPNRNQEGPPSKPPNKKQESITLRPKAEVATVNGVASPGAEFLRSQRTWQGLGSDFDLEEESTAIEEGRSGVARGYSVGENGERR